MLIPGKGFPEDGKGWILRNATACSSNTFPFWPLNGPFATNSTPFPLPLSFIGFGFVSPDRCQPVGVLTSQWSACPWMIFLPLSAAAAVL